MKCLRFLQKNLFKPVSIKPRLVMIYYMLSTNCYDAGIII